MPLVPRMLDELVFALPPLGNGKVCDLAAGNGNASVKIVAAYPRQERFPMSKLLLPERIIN